MLPRTRTLSRDEFARVVTAGTAVHSPRFLIKTQKTGSTACRFSVAVSKKVAKSAVERNSIRRKVYGALRPLLTTCKAGIEGVILVKTPLKGISTKNLATDLKSVLSKGSLI